MRKFISLLLGIIFTQSFAHAGPIQSFSLNVLTYNIKGLPSFAAQGYDENRYGDIGRILAKRMKGGNGPDVVLLQESFVSRTAELRAIAGYPFYAQGPGSAQLLGVDSGLYILSRYPILKQETQAFGPELCTSWDCYSNKGVQFAQIQLPGMPIPLEIYNTHMQASRKADFVRQKQVKVILDFMKRTHRPGAPVIFAGDFNFRPGSGDASFREFVKETSLVHAGEFCLSHHCPLGTGTLAARLYASSVDHQFISVDPTGAFSLRPVKAERNFSELVSGRRLSDHDGFEINYELSWNSPSPSKVN
jgi:endonuclease/exonuclease/phosphatase family metal-dependent hydrolase